MFWVIYNNLVICIIELIYLCFGWFFIKKYSFTIVAKNLVNKNIIKIVVKYNIFTNFDKLVDDYLV